MRDLTDFVDALQRCPDGHFWESDATDEKVRVRNLEDDPAYPPVWRREAFVRCPRCGFVCVHDARDATPEEIAAVTRAPT